MMFLFNDSGISYVRYQVASETCFYYQLDMYGQLSATYTPHSVSGAGTIRSNFEAERANRIPIKSYTALETEFGVNLNNFSADVEATGDMSGKAVYYNGYIYMWPCQTRAGDDPYGEYHLFPSYSTAKTALANLALLKLAQDYGESIFDLYTGDYIMADTAVVSDIIDELYPFSQIRDANVLVFPNLEAANVSYKLMQRLGNAEAIGPVLLGMSRSIHVLQRSDEVRDIANTATLAVIDAQERGCGPGKDK